MLIGGRLRLFHLAVRRWPIGLALAIYAAFWVLIEDEALGRAALPVAVPTLLGTAISIVLGFRTGAAYDRWWEARKIWGAIVNDCRTFARQVLTLCKPPEREDGASAMRNLQTDVIYRQIAWCYALSRSLRDQDPLPALEPFLSHEEMVTLQKQANRPNALLQTQAERIRDARDTGCLDRILSLPLEDTLKRFSDEMGMCERIKSTTFPASYAYTVHACIWIFFLLLPPALVPHLYWWSVPFSMLAALIFVLLETISSRLQDPFENRPSDTPTTAISRTIEINLRQALGETDLPPKLEPVDGILM